MINWPSRFLSRNFYLRLLIIYGLFFRIMGNKAAIRKVEFNHSNNSYKLTFWDTKVWHMKNHVRINRYLKGIDKAGERLVKRYHLDSYKSNFNTFVDVGANVGELCAYFSVRGKLVVAFEPDPEIFNLLKQNVSTLRNIYLSSDALGSIDEKIFFSVKSETADSSLIYDSNSDNLIKVQVRRFENHNFANLISRPSVLKMDTEGFEPEALTGFGGVLKNFDFISVDAGMERLKSSTHIEVSELLKQNGFEIEPIGSDLVVIGKRDVSGG